MDWPKAVGIAIVVGVIGPIFWLGVNIAETKIRLFFSRYQSRRRHAKQSAASHD